MEDNSKSMENYSNIEYVCGVLDTVTSLMTSVLQMDASMNKGEEAIILTLKEKAEEASKLLAENQKADRCIGVIVTVVDTMKTILEQDTNTAKQVNQLLTLLADRMTAAVEKLHED